MFYAFLYAFLSLIVPSFVDFICKMMSEQLQVPEQQQSCSRPCASHAVKNVQSRGLTLRNATQQSKSSWLVSFFLLKTAYLWHINALNVTYEISRTPSVLFSRD